MYLFQCPFSNLQPTWLWGQGYLEADFDTVDLFPQDLVSPDVSSAHNEETRNLEQSIDSTLENLCEGGFRETLKSVLSSFLSCR